MHYGTGNAALRSALVEHGPQEAGQRAGMHRARRHDRAHAKDTRFVQVSVLYY